ncbi:hypothetical protein DFR72_105177 [Lentzea flaviverrucosa]|uniref:Uncharacterized protein n=2 Tax=Lentzea flaviverrucosa TaxID=200379 RepID=A0A1H9PRG2_9PSEU|nr:hypothetical protein DFR72_105177 [Lentzea flaviverrucosa]SER50794.1 hypothetical protein SAMN05216195_105395 [Lentzea flaviverrucosa]
MTAGLAAITIHAMDPEGDRPGVPFGTALRFASLTLLAVAATLLIFDGYAHAWTTATPFDDARCQVRSGFYLTQDAGESTQDSYRECMAAFLGNRLWWLAAGPALLLVVALLFHAVQRAWTRYRRNPAAVPEGPAEPPAGLALDSATRAVFRAFVVAVLVPFAIVVLGTAAGRPQNDQDVAVGTWMYGGGRDRVTAVVRASEQVFTGVRAADPAAIAAGCEALGPVLREPFPAPPDPKIATSWAEALRALENGTRSCLVVFRDNGPDDGSMTSEFLKGLDQLEVTRTELAEAQERAVS